MLILAIDSSAVTATAALLEDDKIIGDFNINNRLTHSEKLLPMIDSLLNLSGYSIDDVELIAAAVGPGSFTGVRIGTATAKGLAFARNLPCVAVSVLEALAENARDCDGVIGENCVKYAVCPCMDARRNELYNALFIYEDGELKRVCEDRAISCEKLKEELEKLDLQVYLCGDGAVKMFEYLAQSGAEFTVKLVSGTGLLQNAASVGRVGAKLYREGKICDHSTLRPFYLRDSQAERKAKEKLI